MGGGCFDCWVVAAVPPPGGGWALSTPAALYFTPPAEPVNGDLLAGLSFIPGSEQIVDMPYFVYATRVDALVNAIRDAGRFGLPHPWFDIFVPDSKIDSYAGDVLATLTPADLGPDMPILLFPLKAERFTRPLLRVPDEEVFFLFDILRTAPDPAVAGAMVASNRELFERGRDLGSKHYTISAIPLSRGDWRRHFQPVWGELESAKQTFDPDNVLTPGPGIFDKDNA